MIKAFHTLAARARTINKLNRIRVAFENLLTPLDLAEFSSAPDLADLGVGLPAGRPPAVVRSMASGAATPVSNLSPGSGPRPDQAVFSEEEQLAKQAVLSTFVSHEAWCNSLAELCSKSGKAQPEPFLRRRLRRNISFFSRGGERSHKVLFLCFTNTARRMMMPLPVFLQHLDASLVDVVLLCDPSRNGYMGGAAGGEGGIEGLLDQLDGLFDRRAYRGAVAMGISTGGLPSVLAALRLKLDAVLCVGNGDPCDPGWQALGGLALLQRYAAQVPPPGPNISLLYAADSPLDQSAAQSLSEVLAGTAVIRHIAYAAAGDKLTGHVVLLPILEAGNLSDLMRSTVFSRFLDSSNGLHNVWVQD